MKLRNKKTGEIVNATEVDLYTNVVYLKISKDGRYDTREYDSLAELNEEWEDHKGPDKCWYLDYQGTVRSAAAENNWDFEKEIGNHFDTKEKAERAVEKLKAWKRLKDKGFRFTGVKAGCGKIDFKLDAEYYFMPDTLQDDLDLLFSESKNEAYR